MRCFANYTALRIQHNPKNHYTKLVIRLAETTD
nr:MAG TPA: hypothetical protein [Inoviridae sp.]